MMSDLSRKKTTCPYCGVGCGVEAEVTQTSGSDQANNLSNARVTAVCGDQSHPSNYGRLCVKGSALDEVLGEQGRLTTPKIKGETCDWDSALNQVAEGLMRTVLTHGPDSVAFYLSGQLLTEDYYVANKLMKGFIGTANVDTNSRLCMSSAVVGYKRAFGEDLVPCSYEDLEKTDLLVLVGSNAAWNHPILFQRMRKAKGNRHGLKVVVIDPRKTATCDIADLHLAIKPGSDVMLFNGLLAYLAEHDCLNQAYISAYTEQFDQALTVAQAHSIQDVAEACDVPLGDLLEFYRLFAANEKVISFYSQGANQSSQGSNNANAIINCHLATGRLGYAGAGPFSITGQPNAMGGREVGGLANQLAAHMDFSKPEDIDRVGRFWQAFNMAERDGLKAVELFQAIESGEVKAVWIMGTNPAVSLPNSDKVCAALAKCPLVIVSDCIAETDTAAYADVCLPATGWSEKDGTVTNAERRISRQRALLPPLGEAKPDWWIISQVAQRMGYADAFTYEGPYQIFSEHAALSGFENQGSRCFDISYFAGIDKTAYDHLLPIQWPVTTVAPEGTARLFSDGRFFTPSGKAKFIATHSAEPLQQPNKALPYVINTGRIRDQWHTMAITGRAEKLFQHRDEPFIEISPKDAQREGIENGALIKLQHPQGVFIGRAIISESQRKGELFVPMHWNRQFSGQGNVGNLIEPVVDALSGQPESKHGRASLERLDTQWQGWLFLRESHRQAQSFQPETLYWARTPRQQQQFFYLADQRPLSEMLATLGEKLGGATVYLEDPSAGYYRAASVHQGELQWVFAVMPFEEIPSSEWLGEQFAETQITTEAQKWLLSLTGATQEDKGQIICSCYQVGEHAIQQRIAEGCRDLEGLGQLLKCGTNCGSCIPEINQLLAR